MPTIEEMIATVQEKYSNAESMDIITLKEKYGEIRDESRLNSSGILKNMNEPRNEEYDGGDGGDKPQFPLFLVVAIILFILFLVFILGQSKSDSDDWNRGY